MITHTHDTFLVLASIAVSLVAAFTGLALTNNIAELPDSKRKTLVVMSAFILGGGIWSMHFVAMLAHRFATPIYYDLLQTLSSALIAILVAGVALLMLHFSARTPLVLTLAGLILGAGIVAMHYLGMLGIRGAIPVFGTASILMALAVAGVAGVAAIRVAYGHRSKQNIVAGAIVFGFAVVAVHYTAMFGTHFEPDEHHQPATVLLANSTLAIAVTVASFVICGSFLLAATTFLTSTRRAPATSPEPATVAPPPEAANDDEPGADEPGADEPAGDKPGGAGPGPEVDSPNQQQTPMPEPAVVAIPFEQGKKIDYVDSTEVAAIRADGHYTHLYIADGVRFCPWSIKEAEERLSAARFHRTHRSYLVNLAAIDSFEKRRETGVCLFENFTHLTSVPVSRNRVIGLMEVLDNR